jgi:hypothetical protein
MLLKNILSYYSSLHTDELEYLPLHGYRYYPRCDSFFNDFYFLPFKVASWTNTAPKKAHTYNR